MTAVLTRLLRWRRASDLRCWYCLDGLPNGHSLGQAKCSLCDCTVLHRSP
jgi:hypothetical protein